MPLKSSHLCLAATVFAAFLGGCGPSATDVPATGIPTDTPIPAATLTPTPAIPLVILVLPADIDQETSNRYQEAVYNLAQSAGYRYQVRNTLTPTDLEPSLRIVIALPPDAGIAALAAAAPQVQFLAINIPDVAPGSNVSVLGGATQMDIAAFLAGYIGAMITEDYHIGMLIPNEDADTQRAFAAFDNGMAYYCGLCNPWAGPFYDYPLVVGIPADEDAQRYGAYVDVLMRQYHVETIFVYPGIASNEMLITLSNYGAQFITASAPPMPLPGLVAAIQPDVIQAIQDAWPALVAGQGGQTIQAPLALTSVDPALLSPGKQNLAEQVLADLLAGRISTGVRP